MTNTSKPTTRCSSASWAGYPIIVQIEGGVIRFRLKGRRQWYPMAISRIFLDAARAFALAQKIEKKRRQAEARRLRRKGLE